VSGFDANAVHKQLIHLNKEHRAEMFRFAGWLWKTGPHDMRLIAFILADAMARNPDNVFAYYAQGSETRRTTEARAREHIAEVDRKQYARDIARLFGSG
jgi:hypothetical protein